VYSVTTHGVVGGRGTVGSATATLCEPIVRDCAETFEKLPQAKAAKMHCRRGIFRFLRACKRVDTALPPFHR
jgi:hypothetical protein